MTDIATRVANGARFLDREVPGWRNEIDLDSLDLESHSCCILGQLFSSYFRATNELKLNADDEIEFGFDADAKTGTKEEYMLEYKLLTDEWKRQITGATD